MLAEPSWLARLAPGVFGESGTVATVLAVGGAACAEPVLGVVAAAAAGGGGGAVGRALRLVAAAGAW